MFDVTAIPNQRPDHQFGPTIEYSVERDGQTLASANLYTRSPIYKQAGQLFVPRWESGQAAAAHAITEVAIRDARAGDEIHLQANTEVHEHLAERLALADAFGFELLSEREGFWWAYDGGDLAPLERIHLKSLAEIGPEAYAQAMVDACVDSLDSVQAAEVAAFGPTKWCREFLDTYVGEGDAPTWFAAHNKAGETVGFVAVGRFEEDAGTIYHVGVARQHRGHGYIDDLVQAAKLAIRDRGWTGMLNEVDLRNEPMLAVMERSGHSADARAWHKWYYRRPV